MDKTCKLVQSDISASICDQEQTRHFKHIGLECKIEQIRIDENADSRSQLQSFARGVDSQLSEASRELRSRDSGACLDN